MHFCGIFDLVGEALAWHEVRDVDGLATVLEADTWVRRFVLDRMAKK
jgi:hypothetical protein